MAHKTVLFLLSLVFFIHASAQAFANTLEQAMADFQNGDYRGAQNTWQDLAGDGDLDAAFNLGQLYHLGQGAAFNETRATEYFLAAAQGGHTAAQRELANIYFFSSGTPEHQSAAIDWWRQAAAAGDGRSQYILGVLYFNGDMIPQNMVLGFAWTLLAIDGGIAEAIQSETAMRGQLAAGDLARSIDLSQTLMTSRPNQTHFSLLVAEEAPGRRPAPAPVQVAEAQPEIETPTIEPEPEVTEDQDFEQAAEPEPVVEQPVEDAPVEMANAETALATEETPEPMLQNDVPDLALDDPEEKAAEEVIAEVDEAAIPQESVEQSGIDEPAVPDTAIVDVQTTPVESTPVETRDLGDPLSPLVDSVGFEGQWRVQVTSFRLPENAEQHWQDVNANYPEIFVGLEKRIVRADLGPERGVYYRLRVGPFAAKEDADLKCQEMVDAGMGCLVIWP